LRRMYFFPSLSLCWYSGFFDNSNKKGLVLIWYITGDLTKNFVELFVNFVRCLISWLLTKKTKQRKRMKNFIYEKQIDQ
jgi:hypothetical protein